MSNFRNGYIFECVKTVIVAVVASLMLVLAFAGIVSVFELDPSLVQIFNLVTKGVSVFVAVLVCFKLPHGGWLRGVVCGVLFALISYLLYGFISGSLTFSLGVLADLALGGTCGFLGGTIAVNSKTKEV